MTSKCHNHKCRYTHSTVRKRHNTIKVTYHQKAITLSNQFDLPQQNDDSWSWHPCLLSKQQMRLSTAQHNKDQTQNGKRSLVWQNASNVSIWKCTKSCIFYCIHDWFYLNYWWHLMIVFGWHRVHPKVLRLFNRLVLLRICAFVQPLCVMHISARLRPDWLVAHLSQSNHCLYINIRSDSNYKS